MLHDRQQFHSLNAQQQQALKAISAELGQFRACLLEGVTGSGKTEVYLRLIEQVLAQGKQALVLVPEIGLTPQTVRRFQARFGVPVALLHSGLNDRERLQGWRQANEGVARILIGTRSGGVYPDARIRADYYRRRTRRLVQTAGRPALFGAGFCPGARAHKAGIPVVLGSATPSLETLAQRPQRQIPAR